MADGSINVTVDSSAVAREVSRLSSDIQSLGNQFHSDAATLSRKVENLQTEMVEGMALAVTQMETVRLEISRGIEAEAQTKLFEQYAAIAGEMEAVFTAAQRLEDRYAKSLLDSQRVTKRYDSLNAEVRQSYQTDIRRLGKHILDIWETHFHKTVEGRVAQKHTGFLTSVLSSIEQIRQARETQLANLLQSTSTQLSQFLEKRQTFETSVKSIKVENLPISGEVALPMIVVKTQGTDQAKVLAGNELVKQSGPMVNYQLLDSDLLRTLRTDLKNAEDYAHWRVMTSAEVTTLENNLKTLVRQGYFSQIYCDYLIQGLRSRAPLTPDQVNLPNLSTSNSDIRR
jgi:uncharacterized protein (DUF885 family)